MLTVRIQEKNHSESIMVLKLKDGCFSYFFASKGLNAFEYFSVFSRKLPSQLLEEHGDFLFAKTYNMW